MAQKAFDKFINPTLKGAKKKEALKQEKKKLKKEIEAFHDEKRKVAREKRAEATGRSSSYNTQRSYNTDSEIKRDKKYVASKSAVGRKDSTDSRKRKTYPERKQGTTQRSNERENSSSYGTKRSYPANTETNTGRKYTANKSSFDKNESFDSKKRKTYPERKQGTTQRSNERENSSSYGTKRSYSANTETNTGRKYTANKSSFDKNESFDSKKRKTYPERKQGTTQRSNERENSSSYGAKRSYSSNTETNTGKKYVSKQSAVSKKENTYSERKPSASRSFGEKENKPSFRSRSAEKEKPYQQPKREKVQSTKKQPFASNSKEKQSITRIVADKNKYEEMPLNKFVAHAGICGRREAAEVVKNGNVTVNGKKILEPGFKVTEEDKVCVHGKRVYPQRDLVYLLLNKPKDYITTAKDPEGRKTVLDLVHGAAGERLYPVGRLDRNTTGVLLLTNDGELAQKLTHPSFEIKKIYEVTLDRPVLKNDMEKIAAGLTLEDGFVAPDSIAYADAKDKSVIGIEIHSGRNRIVRRIFEHMGYSVRNLDRVMFANLTKKNVERGKWRSLNEKEIRLLKYMNNSFVRKAKKGK